MTQLKCYKNCCANNYCTHCVREGIHVGTDALCKSYRERTETNKNMAQFEYEFAMDMGMPIEFDGHPIVCENEQCFYQQAGVCNSKHVRIDDKTRGALCSSFQPK